jgi:hypothetical protein
VEDGTTLPLLVGLASGAAGDEASMALQVLNLCARVGLCTPLSHLLLPPGAGLSGNVRWWLWWRW